MYLKFLIISNYNVTLVPYKIFESFTFPSTYCIDADLLVYLKNTEIFFVIAYDKYEFKYNLMSSKPFRLH